MPLFKPILAGATLAERLVACIGAAIAIAATIILCAMVPLGATDLPIIVAPLGASAVLVFAVPSSPLAQPWPVIGGNILSTLVGVTAFILIPNTAIAAGIAVGGAILLMSVLRCLHPPGGAAALTAVIGGPVIHAAGYGFAFVPVGLNSVVLVAIAVLIHRSTRRRYPHVPGIAVGTPAADAVTPGATLNTKLGDTPARMGLHETDIDAALADMHESFDISREDLDALLAGAERHAVLRVEREARPRAATAS